MSLRRCKHIWICLWRHFNKLFIVSLYLSHVLVGNLMRSVRTSRAYTALSVSYSTRHLIGWDVDRHVSRQVFHIKCRCLALCADISDRSSAFLAHHLHALPLTWFNALFVVRTRSSGHRSGHSRHRSWITDHFEMLCLPNSMQSVSSLVLIATCLSTIFESATWRGLFLRLQSAWLLRLCLISVAAVRSLHGSHWVMLYWQSWRVLWARPLVLRPRLNSVSVSCVYVLRRACCVLNSETALVSAASCGEMSWILWISELIDKLGTILVDLSSQISIQIQVMLSFIEN